MKLVLIGAGMHWQTYAPALRTIPGLSLAGVSTSVDMESLGTFDHAPGLTAETQRFSDPVRMLDAIKPDLAQVCCPLNRLSHWARVCIDRGIPTMVEKPLAMDVGTLERLYAVVKDSGVPLVPMHTLRGDAILDAVTRVVREDKIGRPQMAFSQKSYRWGTNRPGWFRSKSTYPGLMPWVGIHAMDWLHRMLGDQFTEVQGYEGEAHSGYPASAYCGGYVFRMKNGGCAAVTLDFLRPDDAPTHGDERVRIVGSKGLVEASLADKKTSLMAGGSSSALETRPVPDIFTAFVRSVRGEGPPVMSLAEGFRITELALKAQLAAETGRKRSLVESSFR